MKKILTIVGARPQFIKLAPVSRAIAQRADLREVVVHTGQHFDSDMSGVFFSELDIQPPDYSLNVSGGGHGAMTGAMLQKLEPVMQEQDSDVVLVYGDTNSTLAGALVAAKLNIPIAHVEAGLRSFNRAMPEEVNRVVTDHLSSLLFATTDTATENLKTEGVAASLIHQVGDVMYDAALQFGSKAKQRSSILADLGVSTGNFVLATVHRAENTDDGKRLAVIVQELEEVARQMPVVLPLHPRTRQALARESLAFERVTLTGPLGYLDMIALESLAGVVATDSGGVQKEAFFHGVPCVVLRDETEWTELVALGWNRLSSPKDGTVAADIIDAVGRRGLGASPYGDGKAAERIADFLAR